MFELFGKKINTFDELIESVTEELTQDDTYVDEFTGRLPRISDILDLNDFCCDEFKNDEEYEKFDKMLEENKDTFHGIDIEEGDGMYWMSGGGFSSWQDYHNYRFG